MNEEKTVALTIDSDINTRKGVHADAALLAEKDDVVRIDFISTDIMDNGNEARGLLSSRVYMSRHDFMSFRNSIDAMLHNNSGEADEEE